MEILLIALVLGMIPGLIAHNKGHSLGTWWLFGALLFILALPMALMLKPDTGELVSRGEGRQCPYCAELIKPQAVVCRFCGRDLPDRQVKVASLRAQLLEGSAQDDPAIDSGFWVEDAIGSVWELPTGKKIYRHSSSRPGKVAERVEQGDLGLLEDITVKMSDERVLVTFHGPPHRTLWCIGVHAPEVDALQRLVAEISRRRPSVEIYDPMGRLIKAHLHSSADDGPKFDSH